MREHEDGRPDQLTVVVQRYEDRGETDSDEYRRLLIAQDSRRVANTLARYGPTDWVDYEYRALRKDYTRLLAARRAG